MTLAAQIQALRAEKPNLRARDVATALGVSEAALVASEGGIRLNTDTESLLHALCEVGRCMALTRNEHCVSEVKGTYGGVQIGPHAGQVIGEHVDLRVFASHWKHAYAVNTPRRSIQIFDASGVAVHKVYLEPEGNTATWDAIVDRTAAPFGAAANAGGAVVGEARRIDLPLAIDLVPAKKPEKPDSEIDRDALQRDWDAMQDTHEFFHLLVKHGASRTQALRLAGRGRARPVRNESVDAVLRAKQYIMIFVGNRGCIQVWSGTPDNIVMHGPWLNVLDPGFNLHLRADRIATSWVVEKPTRSGVVSSLELFDEAGENIALLFRKRDDRAQAEDPAWGELLESLS